MAAYRDHLAEIKAADAGLVAISVDKPEESQAFKQSLHLPFPLLSDVERKVVSDWGLLNTGEHGGIAYPATWVIDQARTVRFRSLDQTTSRVDLGSLLAFLRGEEDATPEPKRSMLLPDLGVSLRSIMGRLKDAMKRTR